jgi:hypothetical protein
VTETSEPSALAPTQGPRYRGAFLVALALVTLMAGAGGVIDEATATAILQALASVVSAVLPAVLTGVGP